MATRPGSDLLAQLERLHKEANRHPLGSDAWKAKVSERLAVLDAIEARERQVAEKAKADRLEIERQAAERAEAEERERKERERRINETRRKIRKRTARRQKQFRKKHTGQNCPSDYATYQRGCRCLGCKGAAAAYMRDLRQKLKNPAHVGKKSARCGTTTMAHLGCKCPPCTEARRAHDRAMYAKRKARNAE
jgi:hypothetical protein